MASRGLIPYYRAFIMCGIVGVYGTPYAAKEVYQALLVLQHRGQDSSGILSFDFQESRFHLHKDLGKVSQVYDQDSVEKLKGALAIGHNRYSTIGKIIPEDIQPFTHNYPIGMGAVHNGNLVNVTDLKSELKNKRKRHFFSQSDLEVLLHLLAQEFLNFKDIDLSALQKAIYKVNEQAQGGYALLLSIADQGLVAFRDKYSTRPMVWGERELTPQEKKENPLNKSGKSYAFASESNALSFLGYKLCGDLGVGEIIYIDAAGFMHHGTLPEYPQKAACLFEWVYFATPESCMEGQEVYHARLKMGENLAVKVKELIHGGEIAPDVVVPVPETSRISAIGLSEKIGIPYRELLIKNRYIQRSFILNTQEGRNNAVQMKLSPVKSELEGKKVLLLDDSIVRGTTSKRIVDMVRRAGAKEIYFASTCPPIRYPCFFGIDFPDPQELVAYNRSEQEISDEIGADKVIYISLEELKKAIGLKSLCDSCLTGEYRFDIAGAQDFRKQRT